MQKALADAKGHQDTIVMDDIHFPPTHGSVYPTNSSSQDLLNEHIATTYFLDIVYWPMRDMFKGKSFIESLYEAIKLIGESLGDINVDMKVKGKHELYENSQDHATYVLFACVAQIPESCSILKDPFYKDLADHMLYCVLISIV